MAEPSAVAPRQFLAPKTIVNKGLHEELIPFTKKGYIGEVLSNFKGVLGTKLPDRFVPAVGNIRFKWVVRRRTESQRDSQFQPEALSREPEQLASLRVPNRFLEQGHDVADFLGEERVLKLVSLEEGWTKEDISWSSLTYQLCGELL